MIGIQKGDANRQPGSKFDFRWCVQWNRSLLGSVMPFISEEMTNQKLVQVLVVQPPGLQDTLVKVHTMRIFLNTQE